MPDFKRGAAIAQERARAAFAVLASPPRLARFTDEVPRMAQILAALSLPFLIIPSLALIIALRALLEGILLQNMEGGQLIIFSFLITLITGGAFVAAAWFWFFWVRSGGFRVFAF